MDIIVGAAFGAAAVFVALVVLGFVVLFLTLIQDLAGEAASFLVFLIMFGAFLGGVIAALP